MKLATSVQLYAALLVQVVGKFGLLYVFPILPAMTQLFFPELNETQLGYRQGYLAGIYFLGNFFGNFIWVKVANMCGRKRAMILSTILFSITGVVFGLSTSYAMALVLRFLWGMFNGLDTIIKTFIADICEEKDLARGLSMMGSADAVGRMLGPAVSALLSKPAEKYPILDFGLLRKFPFLLPSLVCFLLAVVAIAIAAVLIKETVPKIQKSDIGMLELSDSDSDDEKEKRLTKKTGRISCRLFLGNIRRLLTDRLVLSAVLNFNFFAFISMQFEELIPLVMVTLPRFGGFCMNESSLGVIALTASVAQIPWTLFIVPRIISCLGLRKSLRLFICVYSAVLIGLALWARNPLVRDALPLATNGTCSVGLGASEVPVSVWLLVLPLLVPFFLLRMALFTCYTLGVANACGREARAAINGVSQSGASLARLAGPVFSANVFAWSVAVGAPWPLDSSLVWWLGCLQLLLLLTGALVYPASLEHAHL